MPTDPNNAEADAKLMQQVFRMNREVTKLGLTYARKKEAASDAKKAYEAAQSDMSAFINANQAPLFDEGDEGAEGDEEDEPETITFTSPDGTEATIPAKDLDRTLMAVRDAIPRPVKGR